MVGFEWRFLAAGRWNDTALELLAADMIVNLLLQLCSGVVRPNFRENSTGYINQHLHQSCASIGKCK